MKYATVLVSLLGVNKALKVDEQATPAALSNCPGGFHDGETGYCMPNSQYVCPENMYHEDGSCKVHCAKGFKNGTTYGECIPDKPVPAAKFMWDGGCGAGGIQNKNFQGKDWTIDTCLAFAETKKSTLPWVTHFFLNHDGKSCYLYGDGCKKGAGGPWKFYEITESTPAAAPAKPATPDGIEFKWHGQCNGGVKSKFFYGEQTLASCAAQAKSYQKDHPYITHFQVSKSRKACYLYANGCTKGGNDWDFYKLTAPPKAKFMWKGGCSGKTQNKFFYGDFTLETCLAKAVSYANYHPWVTSFFLGDDKKKCAVYSDGCVKGGTGWNYYKIDH